MVSLGSHVQLLTGFPFKSADYTEAPDGVRLLRGDNIGQGFVRWDGAKRLPVEKAIGASVYNLLEGDVLLAMDRPWIPAGLKFARVQHADLPSLLVQRVACLRPKDGLRADYLAAVIASPEFSDYIQNVTTGTAVPHISAKQIGQFAFRLPEVRIQECIGGMVAALNDRITLLRETNATLEAIAQALFKSWFVDFDPVRAKMEGRAPGGMDEVTAALFPDGFEESALGLVPTGWRVATLTDAFEINPTRALKKNTIAPYLDMASLATSGHCVERPIPRAMGSGAKFRNGDSLLARITPCLENGKSAFVDFLDEGQVGWGSTEFIVLRPKAPLPDYIGYLLCRHPAFREYAIQSMSGTSGRQRVQNDVLGRYPMVLSDGNVAQAFGDIVEPIQGSIAANDAAAQTLVSLRDTLLPRLISGQLRLPENTDALAAEVCASGF
ncbi:restriction endonuclease subunit S [Variovorax ginsengisoli]|uniref:Type I restriction enzyme S subunit n=1 Tax=Variovorax ginsengisoli TaxID=363844 RepID=A0ABT9SCR7_9BURK|nr:restriction endonuclease subunit S [Variovorax ginsengisoli]MDP9902141.1 type I restriction enzyme S subunit [Variovorax ginsengisoli]